MATDPVQSAASAVTAVAKAEESKVVAFVKAHAPKVGYVAAGFAAGHFHVVAAILKLL